MIISPKTKFLIFNFRTTNEENCKLRLGNQEIKRVVSFKYLGSVIATNADVDQRIIENTRVDWPK